MDLNTIESKTGLPFRFPNLYNSSEIIDGLYEESLPVITIDRPDEINLAIWGILPQNYREDWQVFQQVRNTLNLDIRSIHQDEEHENALMHRRCVVIVSGFFASFNYQGQVYPVYIYSKQNVPFYLAGIYNRTHDGFITFSILLEKHNFQMSKLHNVSDSMPIVLNDQHKKIWLGEHYADILSGCNTSFEDLCLTSHTIAKEFYKNNILYDGILEPAIYKDLTIRS
ncbi:SOS response-associated peptidase family protein [Psychroserpens sp. BH13MA-6]